MKDKLNQKERLDILNWLTPIDYGLQQSDILKRRQPETGQWLLASEEYQSWLNSQNRILFCPGIPGAGKTVFTSIVVENLHERFSEDSDIGIAYIYCNFQRQNEQKLDSLLANLLKQLAAGQSLLPNAVKTLYNRHKTKRTRPSLEETLSTLKYVITSYQRIFIIVDALDECQTFDGCRMRFISELLNLQKLHQTNLLATSRYIPEIFERFKSRASAVLEIRASREDVEKYLINYLPQLPSVVQRNEELQNEVITVILEAIDGM